MSLSCFFFCINHTLSAFPRLCVFLLFGNFCLLQRSQNDINQPLRIFNFNIARQHRQKRKGQTPTAAGPHVLAHAVSAFPVRHTLPGQRRNVPAEHTAPKHCRLLLLCDAQLPVQTAGGFFRPFSRLPYFQWNIRTLSVTDKDRHLRTGQRQQQNSGRPFRFLNWSIASCGAPGSVTLSYSRYPTPRSVCKKNLRAQEHLPVFLHLCVRQAAKSFPR